MDILERSLNEVGAVSSSLVRDHCASHEDALAVATALIMSAVAIYKELGGPTHAAAQLYAIADAQVR